MCSVIGVISNSDPACPDAVRGLVTTQNRGEHSTGLVTADPERRGFGLRIRRAQSAKVAYDSLPEIASCRDRIAIGHNRYSTAGRDLERDAQPITVAKPGMAMAHNGQIANYVGLREALERKKSYTFASECDLEALLYAVAQNLISTKPYDEKDPERYFHNNLIPALRATLEPGHDFSALGAYSAVAIIAGKGLLAFTDPHRIRPLSFARREEGKKLTYAIASETIAIPPWRGFTDHQEIGPGEALFIDNNMNVYRETVFSQGVKYCWFDEVYFSRANSVSRGRTIDHYRQQLGRALATEFSELQDRIDNIMAVPRTPIQAAMALAQAWDKPYGGIEAEASERIFLGNDPEQRFNRALAKFSYDLEKIRGKRVGVVDDSVVRGNNSKAVIEVLYSLGAKEVHFFSTFPPYIGVCPGGIDIANEEELLMTGRSLSEAREYIGATTLNFLSLEHALRAMHLNLDQVCLGCTRKEYPFDMSDHLRYQALRREQREELR